VWPVSIEDISIVYLQQAPLTILNQAVIEKYILGKAPDTASTLALALVLFTLTISLNHVELYKVTTDSLHAQGIGKGGLEHSFRP
jgi:hypothetical protein